MQPMVSDDVAAAVADVALGEPMNAMVEVAGPDKIRLDELVRQFLTATGDPRKVVTDANAGYHGIEVNDESLVPGQNPRLGSMHFAEWLSRTTTQKTVTELFSKDLPECPGKEGLMIRVEYPPGGSDPVHRHDAHAFVYVLEGSVVMQLRGAEPVTLKAGETFYEGPNDVHIVGRNASDSKPAKFVVFLVKDKGAPVFIAEK
jgi:quercetin dioxygenase-like cupin family protein